MGITAEDCIVNAVMALYNGTQMDSKAFDVKCGTSLSIRTESFVICNSNGNH